MPAITRDHYLEVNGVPLATPAWEVPTLEWAFNSPSIVGRDRNIPQGPAVAFRRDTTITTYTVPLNIYGTHDQDGEEYEDWIAGLWTNLDYLNANLGFASSSGNGTVDIWVVRGSLDDDLFTLGHFEGFKGSSDIGEGALRTTFDLVCPTALELVPSSSS